MKTKTDHRKLLRRLWYAILYRPTMRLAHRFHWHYAPPIYPDGDTILWCKWCGMRDRLIRRAAPNEKLKHGEDETR